MKYILLFVVVGLWSHSAGAQSAGAVVTNPKLDSLAKLSQQFINANQPDSLYNLMGQAFKQQVSLDKLKEVMDQLSGQVGKWNGLEPQSVTNGIARYKAVFALMPLDFYISQDKQGKIETFLFKPL